MIGDNLHHLQTLQPDSIDLVAIDPPYNSGRDYFDKNGKFSDRFGNPKDLGAEVEIVQRHNHELYDFIKALPPESSRYYTTWIGARIIYMHKALKPTGSIFVQCDDAANSYLRIILDFVFGRACFRNEITWHRTHGKQSDSSRKFGRVNDHILFYAKSDAATFHPVYIPYTPEYIARLFTNDSNDGRGRWAKGRITKDADRPRMHYEFMGITKKWTLSKTKMEEMRKAGRLHIEGGTIHKKRYLTEAKGIAIHSDWSDIKPLHPRSDESIDYPTQKPVSLYRRMIECATNEGDIVLDCFGGSGTTAIAALRSNRDFIMMERNQEEMDIIKKRLQHEARSQDGMVLETHHTQVDTLPDIDVTYQPDMFRNPASPNDIITNHTARHPPDDAQLALSPEANNGRDNDYEMKVELAKRDGAMCWACKAISHIDYLQIDHNKAKRFGGTNSLDNRRLLCYNCHYDKTRRESLTQRPQTN